MPKLEEALIRLEGKLADVESAANALTKAVRRVRGAAKSGQVGDIEKGLPLVAQRAQEAAAATDTLDDSWQFIASEHLSTGFLDELRTAASEAGLSLFEKDGRIYCFPLLLRLEPRDAAVRIGKKLERRIRPKELVRLLAAMQRRPQRFKEQQFLELLYQAYRLKAGTDWQKTGGGQGPVTPVADLHAVFTLLPGSDYTIEEFGRDLLLLDRKPDLRTKDGCTFQFPGATLGRTGVRRVTVYDEEGRERTYIGMRFRREV